VSQKDEEADGILRAWNQQRSEKTKNHESINHVKKRGRPPRLTKSIKISPAQKKSEQKQA
jgi:hypothetical protein